MDASIPGKYGFRRKSEQRSAAVARIWSQAMSEGSDVQVLGLNYRLQGRAGVEVWFMVGDEVSTPERSYFQALWVRAQTGSGLEAPVGI